MEITDDTTHTNEINDSVRHTQSASSLDTATYIFDLGSQSRHAHSTGRAWDLSRGQHSVSICNFGVRLLLLKLCKVSARETSEASDNVLSDQLARVSVIAHLRNLDLELARTESEVQNLLNVNLGFDNLVATGNTQVDSSLTNETGNVGCWEEDQSYRKVEA